MAYKIAVASTDGKQVDLAFNEADAFFIYEVTVDRGCLLGKRILKKAQEERAYVREHTGRESGGCHGGRLGSPGCVGREENLRKLCLIEDCRCILCRKIGFQLRKQLERRAITVFDIECDVQEALARLAAYFDRADRHQNLKNHTKSDFILLDKPDNQ